MLNFVTFVKMFLSSYSLDLRFCRRKIVLVTCTLMLVSNDHESEEIMIIAVNLPVRSEMMRSLYEIIHI